MWGGCGVPEGEAVGRPLRGVPISHLSLNSSPGGLLCCGCPTSPGCGRAPAASSEAWGILSDTVSWTCRLSGSRVAGEVSRGEMKGSVLGPVTLLTRRVHDSRSDGSGNVWTDTVRVQGTVRRLALAPTWGISRSSEPE